MSGGKSSNDQSVAFMRQQAAEAAAKEKLRQSRLDQGTAAINQIYDGTPVYSTTQTPFDWTTMTAPKGGASGLFGTGGTTTPGSTLPDGYSWVQTAPAPAPASTTPKTGFANAGISTQTGQQPTGTFVNNKGDVIPQKTNIGVAGLGTLPTAKVWAVKGPDGTIHYQGSDFDYGKQTQTGTTGGFNDDFFNQYKQSYEDLNAPEEARQYQASNRDLTYNLARSGLLNSSVAANKQGELGYQDALQKAKVVSDADAATATFRQNVLSQKQSAINQLYATEDPTLAANLAQDSAKGLQLTTPTLTPGASLFAPALSAVGSYIASQTSPYNYGSSSPSVAPANQSSSHKY